MFLSLLLCLMFPADTAPHAKQKAKAIAAAVCATEDCKCKDCSGQGCKCGCNCPAQVTVETKDTIVTVKGPKATFTVESPSPELIEKLKLLAVADVPKPMPTKKYKQVCQNGVCTLIEVNE